MSVAPEGPDYDKLCPGCSTPVGDHTIRGWADCLQRAGFDYVLPMEEIPGGPLHFANVDGPLVGEVSVAAAFLDSASGRFPLLRFIFTGPGADPMSRRQMPPVNLVMDANGLRSFRQLVSQSVDRAILAARRGR